MVIIYHVHHSCVRSTCTHKIGLKSLPITKQSTSPPLRFPTIFLVTVHQWLHRCLPYN